MKKLLGVFDTRKEYLNYMMSVYNEYYYDLNRRPMSYFIKKANDSGIKLFAMGIYRFMKREKLPDRQYKGEKDTKEAVWINIRKSVLDLLNGYNKKINGVARAEVIELGLSIVFGIPTAHIILFLGEMKNVNFMMTAKGYKVFANNDLTPTEYKLIQRMLDGSKTHGSGYIIQIAKELGLVYYGGNYGDETKTLLDKI